MQFFYLLNAAMFSRLFFLFRDQPLSIRKFIFLTLLQVFPLFVFRINLSLVVLLVLLILINFLSYLAEKKLKRLNLFRFITFIILLIIFSIFSSPLFVLIPNKNIFLFFQSLTGVSVLFNAVTETNVKSLNMVLAGILFLLNEVNLFIRYLFELFAVVPKAEENNSGEIDKKEYNAGRVIGMLERILILFFVLINQFAAIGFIIAAKGFTRFKELDKREFAEYVLIGTLMSSLFAMAVSLLIKVLIPVF